MKTIKNIVITTVAILSMVGCSHFDDLNSNPTKSTTMNPEFLIATAQMRQTEDHWEWSRYLVYPACWMNQWTGEWAMVEYGGRGVKNEQYLEQFWVSYYPIILRDIIDVIQQTNGDPERINLNSIARIIKAQCFQKLTDLYGDIPYSEAGLAYYDDIIMPKYDTQEDIYNDIFKELREAEAALTPDGDNVTRDLYYGGDVMKWKKFANSLRLRMAMRLVKRDIALAQSEAEDAISKGVITDNSDICYIKHEVSAYNSEGTGKHNGLALRMQSPGDPANHSYRITTELVQHLVGTNDPRLRMMCGSYFTDPAKTDITEVVKAYYETEVPAVNPYISMSLAAQNWNWDVWDGDKEFTVNGKPETLGNGLWRLQPSKYITATDAPYIHLSAAETQLLMAEAAYRGWNVGGSSAQDLYSSALRLAVDQWSIFGVTDFDQTAIDNFVATETLTVGAELMDINTQLWVLHILDPFETWSNWRRTGMPDMVKFNNRDPGANQSNGVTPRRLEYPKDEQLKNSINYNEAIARIPGGVDSWNARVWWDKE